MHSQLLQWIDPRFGVQEVLANWSEISKGLSEAKRERGLQVSKWLASR